MPTKRQKQRDPWAYANEIRKAIEALPMDGCEPEVVRIFTEAGGSPQDKGDAFWQLDEKPGRFPGYGMRDTGWHARLRRTRNHPTHGPAMFATFRGN